MEAIIVLCTVAGATMGLIWNSKSVEPKPKPKSKGRVYVFDIDNTLFAEQIGENTIMIEGQLVSKSALELMKQCVDNDYKISINTARTRKGAESASPVVRKCFEIVGYNYSDDFFSLDPNGPFQYGHFFNKGSAMNIIQCYYGIKDKKNIILFDDRLHNIINSTVQGYTAIPSCRNTLWGGTCSLGIDSYPVQLLTTSGKF